MKKLFTIIFCLCLIGSLSAQNNRHSILDYTTYDWQTNHAARTWTKIWPDGKVSFAFTMASTTDLSDRGTAICAYDANTDTWTLSGGRVENEKTGFGSIAQFGANGLVIAAHTSTECKVFIAPDKDYIEPNSLSCVSILDNTYNPAWPAVMTSGPNRDIIHVVANANQHTDVPGAEGASDPVIYFRSSDGGLSWDKKNIVLPYLGKDYCRSWRANCCYWMETTDDNCLALVINNSWSDGIVLYSYDDGETWERKLFYKHPDPLTYGVFEDMYLYPRWTSCQWDDQHHLHVLYEYNGNYSQVGNLSYYPQFGGVAYWNETMPYYGDGSSAISAIPGNLTPGEPFVMDTAYLMQDIHRSWFWPDRTHDFWPEYMGYCTPLTDNGFVDDPQNLDDFPLLNQSERYNHGNYGQGVCAFPVLCQAGENQWVAVWCGLDENHQDDDHNYYYHLFASFSFDNGATWTRQFHLTNSDEFNHSEMIYPQAAVIGNKLVVVVQEDGETDSYIMAEGDANQNDCFYRGLTFDLDVMFNNYTVTASATPSEGGTVSGGGVYSYGQACTLTATPMTNYVFVNWTRNGSVVSTSPSYTFNVVEDGDYEAHFRLKTYNVSATVSPGWGSVTGTGTYIHGQTATLSVTVEPGYFFEKWTENDVVVSTDPTYSFLVTANHQLVAHIGSMKFFDQASGLYYYITGDNTVEVTYNVTHFNTYTGDVVIPETVNYHGVTYTVTAVGDEAFENCEGPLTSVVVPNTVTSIGEKAFNACTQLRTVILPNSVDTIGEMTFEGCTQLTSVRLPDGITVLPRKMFAYCESLTSFEIPPTVSRLGQAVFMASGLTSVVFPESVTAIGQNAFSHCEGLDSIMIPNSVGELGPGAFSVCRNLRSIHLPETLEVIPANLLHNCTSLTSVTIPATVTEIGEGAFSNCTGLTSVMIPDRVSFLGNEAFSGCDNLFYVSLPETMTYLGEAVFKGCENLRSVTLPQNLTAIPKELFEQCHRLDSIVIPESVTSIGGWAFLNCVSLKEVVIPNQVDSIGIAAFSGCYNLSQVELGSSVSYLAEEAFRTSSTDVKLTVVCLGITPAQCGYTTFPEPSQQKVVKTLCGLENVYRQAWAEYWRSGRFEEDCHFVGPEWYYEILNDDGSITYQYLEYTADTTVNHKDVKIIIRNNTLYDKTRQNVITKEYLYEENDKVYWWNPELEDFTLLYDFGAEIGDEWTIHVGLDSLTLHVDAVEQYEYEGTLFKLLRVSDPDNLFSGLIVCGIGHLTSFFPERLMNRGKGYRVEGIRCFWQEGELVFKYGEKDCDEVYLQYHTGLEETSSDGFRVYPNPTDGFVVVETPYYDVSTREYRVTNLMGQTLLTGFLTGETQTLDLSGLPKGVYFLTINNRTQKIIRQ